MQPNDLPIVILPLDLSDESAAILIDFLHDFTDALERHYAGQLLRREHDRRRSLSDNLSGATQDGGPPF